jgi:hypothetical protein
VVYQEEAVLTTIFLLVMIQLAMMSPIIEELAIIILVENLVPLRGEMQIREQVICSNLQLID